MNERQFSIDPETVKLVSRDPMVITAEGRGDYTGQTFTRAYPGAREYDYEPERNGVLEYTEQLIGRYSGGDSDQTLVPGVAIDFIETERIGELRYSLFGLDIWKLGQPINTMEAGE